MLVLKFRRHNGIQSLTGRKFREIHSRGSAPNAEHMADTSRCAKLKRTPPTMTLGNMRLSAARVEPQFIGLPTFMNTNN
jgi:hypothetical protein